MEATLEGLAAVRVRDVEIALVLAREMKAAADRSVDASLRLEQLQEVFGAESLDSAERARIQTALQMAGLEPRPSLLEADPAQPIRFAVEGAATAPAAPPAEAPAADPAPQERQEFPTVGEFMRTSFRRFRGRRQREGDGVTTAVGDEPPAAEPPAAEPPAAEPLAAAPLEPEAPATEPEPEPLAGEAEPEPLAEAPLEPEPLAAEPEPEPQAAEAERTDEDADLPAPNGHVDVAANGHADLDFDELALPPHETATPADFGASVETVDPELAPAPHADEEPELDDDDGAALEHVLYAEPEPAAYAEPEPEPAAYAEPEPAAPAQPEPVAPPAPGMADLASVLLPVAAIPVLIASFAGWSFGLPFVALALVATGLLAGRRGGGVVRTLRASAPARSILNATALITVAALGIAAVLSGIGGGSSSKSGGTSGPAGGTPAQKPAANTPASRPAATAPAKRPHRRHHHSRTPATSSPNNSTKGLILVPPRRSAPSGSATTPSGTATTPSGSATTPSGSATTPSPTQQPRSQTPPQGTGH